MSGTAPRIINRVPALLRIPAADCFMGTGPGSCPLPPSPELNEQHEELVALLTKAGHEVRTHVILCCKPGTLIVQ